LNIDWVIPCRYVEVHDNLGTIIGAGIDTYWVDELPAQILVVLAVRLLAIADELDPDQTYNTTSRVRDPRGELVSQVAGEFTVSGEGGSEEWLTGLLVPTVVELEASEEGAYTIEHAIDNDSASLPIHIVHGRPPGMPPKEP
jgi:hypothetical protein